jgi:hypothetical protein
MPKKIPDRSGNGYGVDLFTPVATQKTITTGGVAQVAAANNPDRRGITIVNNSVGDLWVNPYGTAGPAGLNGSSIVAAGAKKEDGATGAVSIYGATTAQAFTVVEE